MRVPVLETGYWFLVTLERPIDTLTCLLDFDREHTANLTGRMAGVDEAGRGPLAGPVIAAAVILVRSTSLEGLNDSKKVLPARRELLFRVITRNSLVGIGAADESEIEQFNIYQATRLAMKRAVLSLARTPDFVFIDGPIRLDLPLGQKSIIKGDEKSASIAAASIVAKVYRDGLMQELDRIYPGYRFGKHKGYATAEHLNRLRKLGPAPVHRKSFAPVAEILAPHPTPLPGGEREG